MPLDILSHMYYVNLIDKVDVYSMLRSLLAWLIIFIQAIFL